MEEVVFNIIFVLIKFMILIAILQLLISIL